MLYRILSFVVAIIAMCGCYDNHSKPILEEFSAQANCTIAQLGEFCKSGCYSISSDIVCVGRVTTSDRAGNFYRSMFVEDSTGAVEVKLGTYNIDTQYPVGLLVALRLKGTAITLTDDILQLGLPPQSYDSAPREFEAQSVIDYHIIRSNIVQDVVPIVCDISALNTSLCGRFVRVAGIFHSPTSESDTEHLFEGYHRFVDGEDNAVFSYSSIYSTISDMIIPITPISLQGILFYDTVEMGIGKQFIIKPRFEDDIQTIDNNI